MTTIIGSGEIGEPVFVGIAKEDSTKKKKVIKVFFS